MTFYRNRETGIIQSHPTAGLGDSFNSDEVGEDGKPVKPFIPLGASTEETSRRIKLAKAKTPEATTGTGSTNEQEGVQ